MLPWIKKTLIVAALIGVLTAVIVTAVLVSSNNDNDRGNDRDNGSAGTSSSSSSILEESVNPPGEFCVANSGCSKPGTWVVPLPVPEIIDGTNGFFGSYQKDKLLYSQG